MSEKEKRNSRLNPKAPYEEFQGNSLGFVEKIIRPNKIYREQEKILKTADTGEDVSIISGHGPGKTAGLAWLGLHTISCYPMSKVVCTAPTEPQIKDILFAEIIKWLNHAGDRLLKYFESFSLYVNHRQYPKNWRIVGRVSNHPDNMRGFHAKFLRFIIDEASGVSDEILDAIDGAMTENEEEGGHNQLIYASNPSYVKTGRFYESHFETGYEEIWKRLHFNSETAERVSKKWLAKMRQKYIKNGEKLPEYYVMVLGEYPQSTVDQVCTEEWLMAAKSRQIKLKPQGTKSFGIDIARGGQNQTVITLMQGGIQLKPAWKFAGSENKNPHDLADKISAIVDKEKAADPDIPVKLVVDDTGCGWAVSGILEKKGYKVIKVVFGSAAEDRATYENNKVEMLWNLRQWFANGEISILPDNNLEAQLLKAYFQHKANGQKRLIDAHETIRDGRKQKNSKQSPDELHSLALAMYPFSAFSKHTVKPVCLGQELDDKTNGWYQSKPQRNILLGPITRQFLTRGRFFH